MRTVFVIDDDGLMREVLSRLFEKNGYRVRAFQGPKHALPLIDSQYPDAIVSDIQMPGITGIELARLVRERAARTPVVLVSGAADTAVRDEAERLGVRDIFEKPIADVNRLVGAVDRAISRREDEERSAGLDGLRLSFLTGLAHELRTPLTAIKLALENLFAAHAADHCSTEGRLLAISQRNLDRIVRLVEGQLDLLQITLGDMSVARRLVSLRDVLEAVAAETPPAVRKRVLIAHAGPEERPFFFTDPDRLRAVVRYLLESAPSGDVGPLAIRYALDDEGEQIELRFENVRLLSGEGGVDSSLSAGDAHAEDGGASPAAAAGDRFELRAVHRIIASLCGEIRNGMGEASTTVSVVFPVAPRFDVREDFDVPVGCLREASMLSGRAVSLVKCRVERVTGRGSGLSAEENEFFTRCRSVLSEGDALVRGRSEGTYYLALVERRPEEIDHIVGFLRAPGALGNTVEVSMETPAPDSPLEDLPSTTIADLETVG